ncbi:MAG: transporter substrate-binding domain-containing protein [Cyanobacteria bacterium P01_D01_bin.156]
MIHIPLPRPPHWLSRLFLVAALVLSFSILCDQPALASPLRFGNEGAAVEQLQTQLQSLGYLESDVNGLYDELTRQAIQAFQKDLGLPADGVAGAKTQRQLAEKVTDSPRSAMPPDIQRILDRGKLIVALLGTDNSPFFMEDANHHSTVGLDIKIAQGLAEALDVDLEFNRSAETFNEVVDKVYQLEADIAISKLSRTLSRAQRVRFSRPYVTMRQGLLVNRLQIAEQSDGNQVIEAIRNFNGDVGVIQGSSYGGFIKQKFPKATIKEYPTWDDIVDAVIQGKIQAAYRDELEVKKVILKNPDAALRLQTIALTDTQDQIAMALPWDSQNLQALVNQYLDTFSLNYTADDVLDEYADYLQE